VCVLLRPASASALRATANGYARSVDAQDVSLRGRRLCIRHFLCAPDYTPSVRPITDDVAPNAYIVCRTSRAARSVPGHACCSALQGAAAHQGMTRHISEEGLEHKRDQRRSLVSDGCVAFKTTACGALHEHPTHDRGGDSAAERGQEMATSYYQFGKTKVFHSC
jgi:hypothetical protein